jgi:hypothetical protein
MYILWKTKLKSWKQSSDNNSVIMYRDGEIEAQQNIAGYAKQNEDNSRIFNIGSETGTPGRYIKGGIKAVLMKLHYSKPF